ncbi:MAG: PIG-L family deacetylase [Nocardiopsis sp. BM-2018]|nr:MAG: PIG-L family deacetylase [Nocardiopsis sp. BM-2018]
MATLVCFHAHPDDEAISTGGTMAIAHDSGHRVVLVVATDGRHGEVPDDLTAGETLVDRRRTETMQSAAVLGIDRVVFLDYADSGMTGWEQNGHDGSFWRADVDEAAARLAGVLVEESADVLTTYDWHGGYGHPDHIQVHRVGTRAAEMARATLPALRVLEATMNRDELARLAAAHAETMPDAAQPGTGDSDASPDADVAGIADFDPEGPADDGNPFGSPAAEIALEIAVSSVVARKREAIAAHRSQVSDSAFFLTLDDAAFTAAFGREWFIEPDRTGPPQLGWVFDHLDGATTIARHAGRDGGLDGGCDG